MAQKFKQKLTVKCYEVRTSKIHGTGVFAVADIPAGMFICEYFGEKISKKEGDRREKINEARYKADKSLPGTYLFELDDQWDLDGDISENDAKYINHSCNPNCEFKIDNGHIYILAKRDINAGEELGFNYGFGFDKNYKDYPCKCGSTNCVGCILDEEDWPKIRDDKK